MTKLGPGHIFVGLLKVKSKDIFLHSKVPEFRCLGVFFQMNFSKKDFEKKQFLCQKGVEIRVLDGRFEPFSRRIFKTAVYLALKATVSRDIFHLFRLDLCAALLTCSERFNQAFRVLDHS